MAETSVLTTRFTNLCSSFDLSLSIATTTAEKLVKLYSKEQRYYHTLSHLTHMLTNLESLTLPDLLESKQILEYAIWFHDCIYDPKQSGGRNEEDSIILWEEFVQSVQPSLGAIREQVTVLIRATIKHLIPEDITAEVRELMGIFLDLDLAILSSNTPEYDVYAQQIRKEYAHYPDTDYRKGRIAVLNSFLQRERLFFTEGMFEIDEEKTRKNLKMEIERLEDPAWEL